MGLGPKVIVHIGVADPFGTPERVNVKNPPAGVGVGELVNVDVAVVVEVKVSVKVKPGGITGSLANIDTEDAVGEKNIRANASCVNARSRGVAVAVNLGTRTISSCASGLPPAIRTGKLKARTQTPIITSITIDPCAFKTCLLLSCL